MKKKILISATIILLAALLASTIILTADRIKRENNLKNHFAQRISEAAEALSEYENTGNDVMYRSAFMTLESASAVALTLEDEDYRDAAGVLSAICSYYAVDSDALALFHGELAKVLKGFDEHGNIDNLYLKLLMINNRLAAFRVYSRDKNIMLIVDLADAQPDEVKTHYDAGGLVIVLADDASKAQELIKGLPVTLSPTPPSSDGLMQATIFYKIGGAGGTYVIEGNSRDLVFEIEDAIKIIEASRKIHGGIE